MQRLQKEKKMDTKTCNGRMYLSCCVLCVQCYAYAYAYIHEVVYVRVEKEKILWQKEQWLWHLSPSRSFFETKQ